MPALDPDGNPIPEGNVQTLQLVAYATAAVTHADGLVCDETCEANNHYRTEEAS